MEHFRPKSLTTDSSVTAVNYMYVQNYTLATGQPPSQLSDAYLHWSATACKQRPSHPMTSGLWLAQVFNCVSSRFPCTQKAFHQYTA